MSELEQEKSTQPRRLGAAKDATVGDPLLEGNPYFSNEVCFYTDIDMLLSAAALLPHMLLSSILQGCCCKDAAVSYCCVSLVCMLLHAVAVACMLMLTATDSWL